LPNPCDSQTVTLAVASYVVVHKALRGFQQFTQFSFMPRAVALRTQDFAVSRVESLFGVLREGLDVVNVQNHLRAAALANFAAGSAALLALVSG
jgi:hypothetical protein